MEKEYLIAYDVGTSGTKASLFSVDGSLVTSSTEPYDVYFEGGGVCEQDPDDWWRAVVDATGKLTAGIDASAVRAVSFSGQMMGCPFVDRDKKPLRRSIIWSIMGRSVWEWVFFRFSVYSAVICPSQTMATEATSDALSMPRTFM